MHQSGYFFGNMYIMLNLIASVVVTSCTPVKSIIEVAQSVSEI
jgi:hypothetical protein